MTAVYRVSVERCVACGKCELACAFAHGQGGVPGVPRIRVTRQGPERGIPITCLQCHDAACEAVCPVAALHRDDGTGAIALDDMRCVRCGMCVAACPFGNMVWDAHARRAVKCDLCGDTPCCVPFCPTRALEFLPSETAAAGLAEDGPASGAKNNGATPRK